MSRGVRGLIIALVLGCPLGLPASPPVLSAATPPVTSAAPGGGTGPAVGVWEGSAVLDTTTISLRLEVGRIAFGAVGDSLDGHIDVGERKGVAVRGRWTRCGDLSLDAAPDSGAIRFSGRPRDGVIEGEARIARRHGRWTMVQVAELDSVDIARLEGSYEIALGHVVTLTRVALFGLTFGDYATGETRGMTTLSRTSLSAAPTLFGRVPVEFRIDVAVDPRDGATGLTIRRADGQTEQARRLHFRHEEVTFRNGDVVLSGTLVLPNGTGSFPAVVRTHGSGPTTRESPSVEWNAYNGLATLSYDKRGSGRSGGTLAGAGIDEFARDALAGVALLKSRPDIDAQRIGVAGGSEGAWVAARAAAISPDVRWVFVSGFSGHSIPESIAWRVETVVRMDGRFTPEQAAQAGALRRLFNTALFDNRGWAPLRDGIERWRNEPWFSLARVPPRLPAEIDTAAFGRDASVMRERHYEGFDPDTAWSRVQVPVLFLACGHDRSAASLETWPRIESALKRAGNTQYTLRVFPTGNHEGLESITGADEEYPRLHRYAPGYFDESLKWLRATLRLPMPAGPSH